MAQGRRREVYSDDEELFMSETGSGSGKRSTAKSIKSAGYDEYKESKEYKIKNKASTNTILACLLGTVPKACPSARNSIISLSYDLTHSPARTARKLGIYVWCLVVLVSLLSLLGIPINPMSQSNSLIDLSSVDDDDAEDEVSAPRRELSESSWTNYLQSTLFFGKDSNVEMDNKLANEASDSSDEEVDLEDIPQQILPSAPKQGNKIDKKLEKELACTELVCVDSCNNKIKAKCAKSASCRKEREKLCKRRCRKQRCEERCKDEPKFGYVEREQRMEKCKDECTGPTAVHNKCIKKCHSQFKPCKSRCHEIAYKFSCDKLREPKENPLFSVNDASDNDEDNEREEDEEDIDLEDDDGSLADADSDSGSFDIDSIVEDAKSKTASSSSSSSLPKVKKLNTLDLLEDPEII